MNRDEVMEMEDEELQIRVAGLLGATDVERGPQSSALMGYWPEGDEGCGEGWKPIEDYPNDIAAAWKLWDILARERFIVSLENSVRGEMLLNCRGTGERKLIDVFIRDQESNASRAITRAFIVTMGESKKEVSNEP